MNAQTRLSAKGQVVIPKDVRDRMGLTEGTVFDVIERGDEVAFRFQSRHATMSAADAQKRIREIFTYSGPRISDEELAAAGPKMAEAKYRRFSKQTGK